MGMVGPVMAMSYDRIDRLLRVLPAAPAEWVALAEEMPRFQRALARLAEQEDGVTTEHLGVALRHEGLEPDERRQRILRRLHEARRRRWLIPPPPSP
jgi:hypothetical protein